MEQRWPSLSIIIPSYNQGQFIERTILSILKQDYAGPLQIIVADGGSTDATVEVLRRYPQLTWWSRPDDGFVDAVNQALEVAEGEIVGIQSSDDFYLQGAFETALPHLSRDPGLAFVTGSSLIVAEDQTIIYRATPLHATLISPAALLLDDVGIPQHGTFIRRSAIERIGRLRPGADRCADYDLWYRILHFYRGLMIPEYLGAAQIHGAQRTRNLAPLWLQSLEYMIESCEKDSVYADRYKTPLDQKEQLILYWQLKWLSHAGGPAEVRRACKLARKALKDDSLASQPVKTMASVVLQRHGARERLAEQLKRNPYVRAVFRKRPIEQAPSASTELHGLQVAWMYDREPAHPSDASFVANPGPGLMA